MKSTLEDNSREIYLMSYPRVRIESFCESKVSEWRGAYTEMETLPSILINVILGRDE